MCDFSVPTDILIPVLNIKIGSSLISKADHADLV